MIGVVLKIPLKTRLGICIYKNSLPHRPDDYIGFTSSCPPPTFHKQNCAHGWINLQMQKLYMSR